MGKSSGSLQQVNEYNMSIHFGMCLELDALSGIYIGEKQAWTGSVVAEGSIDVNAPDLFGGTKKEGGARGTAYYLPGGATQVLPDGLAARRGGTGSNSPAYRGLATVYFVGSVEGSQGFYWGNTPYLPTVWLQGRRAPKGLDPAYAMIAAAPLVVTVDAYGHAAKVGGTSMTLTDNVLAEIEGNGIKVSVSPPDGNGNRTQTITINSVVVTVTSYYVDADGNSHNGESGITVDGVYGPASNGYITLNGVTVAIDGSTVTVSLGSAGGTDANPAHIIYECLTNSSWGAGLTNAVVDASNMEAVGRVLYHENFGLSLIWTRQTTIEAFIKEIQDHIQAAIYIDFSTGKLTLKLFRDDYDATTLPRISPDNADLDNFQRKLWGETVNEIVVTWTNPINEQEETITQQDLGNIVSQGATVSDSRNYYGVRNAALASRLAARDVRQSAAPLASMDVRLDRTLFNVKPGDVLTVTWPEYEISNLLMRVVSVDNGKVGSPEVLVSLLEDIFSLEHVIAAVGPTTGFVDTTLAPTPIDKSKVITAPAYFTSRMISAATAATLEPPEVRVAILGASTNPDASFYEVVGQVVLPNSNIAAEERGTKGLLGWLALATALPEEATTTISSFSTVTNGIGPTVAGFMFIGDATERTMEIALIESHGPTGWTIQRGALDTVPRAWPAGTSVWFYDVRNDFFDRETHSSGQSVAYKLLTITSQGKLSLDAAPVIGTTLTDRPYLPNRPANVVIAGVAFGPVDLSRTTAATVPISWSNRNRTMEDASVLRWSDATIPPEVGQTTSISLRRISDGQIIATFGDLTGISYDLAVSAFGSEIEADVVISAKRDGMESLQSTVRRVRIAPDPGGAAIGTPAAPADPVYVPPQDNYPPPQPAPNYRTNNPLQ